MPSMAGILQAGLGYAGAWQPIPYRTTALITGASSGIGLQFARVFAENGFHLVLVADAREQLEAARNEIQRINPQIRVLHIVRDLTAPTAGREVFDEIRNQQVQIDILVNNAAVTSFGKFVDSDLEQQIRILQLNTVSMVLLTWLFAKDMLSRGRGKILNISSVTAYAPGPNQAVYAACSSFILSFSEALSYELSGTGVNVTCLLPGATKDTAFAQRAGLPPSGPLPRALRGWAPMLDAETVARRGYRAMITNRTRSIPGWIDWAMIQLSNFVPKPILTRIAYYLNTW
jgi:short-subunit dehydrogenase